MSVCKILRDSVNTAVATDARLCSMMLRVSAPLRTTKCNIMDRSNRSAYRDCNKTTSDVNRSSPAPPGPAPLMLDTVLQSSSNHSTTCVSHCVRQADAAATQRDARCINIRLLVVVVPCRHQVLRVDQLDQRQAASVPPHQPDVEPARTHMANSVSCMLWYAERLHHYIT